MFSRLTCEPFRVKLKIKKYLETMASYQMIFHSLKLPFVSSISLKGSTFHPAFDNFVILFFLIRLVLFYQLKSFWKGIGIVR